MRYCMILCLIVPLLFAGCTSAGSRTSISITMLPDSRCSVAGEVISPDRLDRALKSAGAGAQTHIRITLSEGASEESMRQLARRLSAAGYRLIHFQTPRKATSFVGTDSPPGPTDPNR